MAKQHQDQEKPEGKSKGKGKAGKTAKAHVFAGKCKTKTPKSQRPRKSWAQKEFVEAKVIPPMSDFESVPDGFDGKGRQKYVHKYLPTGEAFSQKEFDELRSNRAFNLRLAATATRPANPSA